MALSRHVVAFRREGLGDVCLRLEAPSTESGELNAGLAINSLSHGLRVQHIAIALCFISLHAITANELGYTLAWACMWPKYSSGATH
jgi:hypothetical protein